MNTKKSKSKNRPNKPQNPNPPQNIDESSNVSDKIDNVLPEKNIESAQKLDERVPEIISAVQMPPVTEIQEKEETPKKPKRNRGKKKKEDKDEDDQFETPLEDVTKNKLESIEAVREIVPEGGNVAPNARKKKNKNKKSHETELDITEKSEPLIAEKKTEEIESCLKEANVSEETEQEIKSKKKNKKKKHRHDSEKSEKLEEISCTTAFQNLIEDEKCEINVSDIKTVSKIDDSVEVENISKQDVKDIDLQKKVVELEKGVNTGTAQGSLKQLSIEGSSKNKKKNKKDKNYPPKEDEKIDNQKCSKADIGMVFMGENTVTQNKPDDLTIPLQENVSVDMENISVEEMTKAKAKIAKPVERKKKEKTDNQTEKEAVPELVSLENVSIEDNLLTLPTEIPSFNIKDEVKTLTEKLKDDEQKVVENIEKKEKITVVEIPTEKHESLTLEILTEVPKQIEQIFPPDHEMGKKRKKSPKPKRHVRTPKSSESEAISPVKPIEVNVCEIKEDKISLDDKTSQEDKFSLDFKEHLCNILEPEMPQESTPTDNTLLQTDSQAFDNKSKKKRKKSPKLPMETKTAAESEKNAGEEQSANTDLKTKDSQIETGGINKDVSEILLDLQQSTDDIEICSLKAGESDGSICAMTPDIIQHPRATSQDVIDDNNNMMIQEITAVEASKLQIPTDIPDTLFIQGSGETPLVMPQSIIIDSKSKARGVKSHTQSEPEKTDIKSKMMEVNQDMEELRLSIEKSLAELTAIEKGETAIEKGETEIEKSLIDTVLHIKEEDAPIEVKLSMPSDIVAKSLPEKMESGDSKKQEHKNITLKDILSDISKTEEPMAVSTTLPMEKVSKKMDSKLSTEFKDDSISIIANEPPRPIENVTETSSPPICPARKDQKGKGKSKKKGKQDSVSPVSQTPAVLLTSESKEQPKENKEQSKKESKSDQKSESAQNKGKQQSAIVPSENNTALTDQGQQSPESSTKYKPIESFEDAMTSSADDINKTFELIANEENSVMESSHVNPEIKIIAPIEDTKKERKDGKVNPLSQPKNLLGHPDIPVPSNRIDYKKEKNKSPNEVSAKVKIKDAIEIESKTHSKESQTENIRKFMKNKSIDESFSVTNENDEFIYKYSFRKVFLQSACHVCKKDLKQARIPCNYCNLVFYCNGKHKDEDWPQHQALCFAVSTIVHLKDQKHIYADSKNITGQDYRLLRMQMIISCEKVLKRKLVPWEQEALLYPRICAEPACRDWRQNKLVDCDGCGQISFCAEHPGHFPKTHQRWCKSYLLYQKLVVYQQTKGRLEPKMPSKVLNNSLMPEKMNEVLASMYEEKIDMNDVQYAALTQIATAPLTAAYCHQMFNNNCILTNGTAKKTKCTIHVVGAELQFEADALNKWEVFFLHLRPSVQELRVVLISADLNPSNLPLELLSKVKLCDSCQVNNRRMVFSFQDKKTYQEFCSGEEYLAPDLVCAFNASIGRSSTYSKDPWPKAINCILKQRVPFIITSYTLNELQRDLIRIKEVSETKFNTIIDPKNNNFAAVRPDRNFISDDDMPLLFKNYCLMLLCGA